MTRLRRVKPAFYSCLVMCLVLCRSMFFERCTVLFCTLPNRTALQNYCLYFILRQILFIHCRCGARDCQPFAWLLYIGLVNHCTKHLLIIGRFMSLNLIFAQAHIRINSVFAHYYLAKLMYAPVLQCVNLRLSLPNRCVGLFLFNQDRAP